MNTTAIKWLLALAIVALFAAMQHLDAIGPSDHITEINQAQDLHAAIKNEASQARFAGAASEICGDTNWSLEPDGTLHCHSRTGAL